MGLANGADPKIGKSGSEWKCGSIYAGVARGALRMLAFARRSSVEPPNFNAKDLMP